MKIAIASGKGGTGKTTIATNLSWLIAQKGQTVQYIDCDVEEPNGHIFLKPNIKETQGVTVGVPEIDMQLCNGCGKCGQLCQYSAIVCLKDKPLVFEQLCHSCGGCILVCPTGAIKEKQKKIGAIDHGMAGDVEFVQGRLKVGDIRSPALIKKVKEKSSNDGIVIIDAPPGTSCPVIEAVKGTDLVLLVTEPTPFGLNDLKLAIGMVRQLKLPFYVVVNRSGIGNEDVYRYCEDENVEVVLKISDDRQIAQAYSAGKLIVEALPYYKDAFTCLYERVSGLKAETNVER
jgi:MinD superfamily P-loop ATPase